MPTRFSAPFGEGFPSHGDWLLRLVDKVWRLPDGSRIELDVWQRWLIRAILEIYPVGHPRAGELRYRQGLVSGRRENGKRSFGGGFGDGDRVLRGAGTDYLHPSTRGDPRPPDFSGQIRALDGHSGYPVT